MRDSRGRPQGAVSQRLLAVCGGGRDTSSLTGGAIKLSVLVPVYNGQQFLESCVQRLVAALGSKPYPWEIVICENGSTDGTRELCEHLSSRYRQVHTLCSDEKGRGRALSRAAAVARGDILAYVDVDMATDIRAFDGLLACVENGSDIATGSRYLPQSRARRSPWRLVVSKTFNEIVHVVFRSPIRDHQCGFKTFKRDALLRIVPEIRSTQWFWDTELLVRAQRMGFRVDEIPVDWREMTHGSTFRFRRDVPLVLRDILALRKELNRRRAS